MSGEALTIGEVIGRLAADFPDLTVSKIRYLESGGLISPGRTPAGYRRFSEEDVEKLRWVLAAQRDQYLPLKVIRQHLAADGPRVTAGDADAIVAALTAGADEGSQADTVFEADPDLAQASAPESGAAGTAAGAASGAAPTAEPDQGHRPLPPPSTLTPPLPPIPQPLSRAATVADAEFYLTARSDVGELHLGRDGLARTAGVAEAFVDDLVAYGLLPSAEDYGGDAVFIARAASALTEYGLEPRHLRPLLTGARNTAGLLGLLLPARRHDGVTGTGRQAAAHRAASRTAQASAAAVRLYGALLRAELAADGAAPAAAHSVDPGQSGHPVNPVGPGRPRQDGPPSDQPFPPLPRTAPPPAPAAHAASAEAETPPAPSAPASRASSRNPGMPGGPAAR